jgi:hypothetical protein
MTSKNCWFADSILFADDIYRKNIFSLLSPIMSISCLKIHCPAQEVEAKSTLRGVTYHLKRRGYFPPQRSGKSCFPWQALPRYHKDEAGEKPARFPRIATKLVNRFSLCKTRGKTCQEKQLFLVYS